MEHPVKAAALDAGFLAAAPATAHPLERWKERLMSLPLGQLLRLDGEPEAACGWPLEETTAWLALYDASPFCGWPGGYGEVSGYYFASQAARARVEAWNGAVRALGYETVPRPKLPLRALALRAGLGICGLNGLMISQYGSFIHIAALLVRSAPPENAPGPEADSPSFCAGCGKCIGACPAGAITENGVDAVKCLRNDMSYPSLMPESHYDLMGNRILGCEACQRACPMNRAVKREKPDIRQYAPFELETLLSGPDMESIAELIGKNYARKGRIQTQAVLAAANSNRKDLVPAVRRHLDDGYEPLRKSSEWALRILEERSKA